MCGDECAWIGLGLLVGGAAFGALCGVSGALYLRRARAEGRRVLLAAWQAREVLAEITEGARRTNARAPAPTERRS